MPVGFLKDTAGQSEMEVPCLVSLLAQRAVSEDPRWTRAVGDQTGRLLSGGNKPGLIEHSYRYARLRPIGILLLTSRGNSDGLG